MAFHQVQKIRSVELKAAQAETSLRVSELDRLEAQLQPHFLFNALTAVLACRHDPDAVACVTTGLSEYLRFCLSRQANFEPLSQEIEGLEHFLVVQQVRFGASLDCQIRCSPEARSAVVPAMLVGPLLDNAFKYGAQTSPGKLSIEVDCCIENKELIVTVFNSGCWVEPGSMGRRGTGLENLMSRLELLGVEGAQLACRQSPQGVQVRVVVPSFRSASQQPLAAVPLSQDTRDSEITEEWPWTKLKRV